MQIEDSHRLLRDGHNLGQITRLAAFFIPFSLIATTFCMQPKVTDITIETVRLYFASSVPLAVVTVLIAWVLSHRWIQILCTKLIREGQKLWTYLANKIKTWWKELVRMRERKNNGEICWKISERRNQKKWFEQRGNLQIDEEQFIRECSYSLFSPTTLCCHLHLSLRSLKG
jgi:hypothetical protein